MGVCFLHLCQDFFDLAGQLLLELCCDCRLRIGDPRRLTGAVVVGVDRDHGHAPDLGGFKSEPKCGPGFGRVIDTYHHRASGMIDGIIADHRDRTVTMRCDSVRDTTKQAHGHRRAALPPGSDDHQLGIPGPFRKHVGGITLNGDPYDVQPRVFRLHRLNDGVDLLLGLVTRLTLKLGGLRDHGYGNGWLLWNDVDHQQRQLSRDCAVGRPFHRLVGTL